MDPKAVALQMLALVKKANAVGLAAETAIDAFIQRLWPQSGAADADNFDPHPAYSSLSHENKALVDDCAKNVRGT